MSLEPVIDDGAVLRSFTELMNAALGAWDSDKDARVGKMLAAFAGKLHGYDKRIDEFRRAVGTIERNRRWTEDLNDELDKGDSWDWIRRKFEGASEELRYLKPREDRFKATRYEVMGWLHCLFGDANYKNLAVKICIEQQEKRDLAEKRADAAEDLIRRALADRIDDEWLDRAAALFAEPKAP